LPRMCRTGTKVRTSGITSEKDVVECVRLGLPDQETSTVRLVQYSFKRSPATKRGVFKSHDKEWHGRMAATKKVFRTKEYPGWPSSPALKHHPNVWSWNFVGGRMPTAPSCTAQTRESGGRRCGRRWRGVSILAIQSVTHVCLPCGHVEFPFCQADLR